MANILKILKRDILRLFKAPAALVVVIALLILPSAYTWYNVIGFWNPYENTAGMRVAVVNEDSGGQSDLTGQLCVGDKIVEALSENEQLDWVFCDYDTAMADLSSGRDYAAFVIPSTFTSDLLTIATGDFVQPKIQYYVNEKTGPVAPKVTDTGASSLEQQINSTFVETVCDAAVRAIDEEASKSRASMDSARSEAVLRIDEAIASVGQARQAVASVSGSVQSAQSDISSAKERLKSAHSSLNSVASDLGDVSKAVQDAASKLPQSSADMVADLDTALSILRKASDSAQADSGSVAQLAFDPAQIQQAIKDLTKASDAILEKALPEMVNALGQISTICSRLSASAQEQQVLVSQADSVLCSLDETLSSVGESMEQTDRLLVSLEEDLESVRADMLALSQSGIIARLTEQGGLNAESVAEFMGSPTQLETQPLYYMNAYGSAMAPLFMNLTFWIGAFCLLVILKQEVDDEGVEDLTLTQRYLSRFTLFALLAALQALICCGGVLVIGVQAVNVAALLFASCMASLAYLSIIYALSITLQHIGKGLCIMLVFLQIPAATGLYPVEMTSPFYQAVSPFFPFTYGIAALRESLYGFYGYSYLSAILCLLAFFVLAMAFGILVRPAMSNVNRMFASQVRESGMFNGEDVEVPYREFSLGQVLRLVFSRQEYREKLQQKNDFIERRYKVIVRTAVIVGILVPVAASVLFALTTTEKVIILTLWLVWMVALSVFLVVVENIRFSVKRQLLAQDIPFEDLAEMYASRHRVTRTCEERRPDSVEASESEEVEADA